MTFRSSGQAESRAERQARFARKSLSLRILTTAACGLQNRIVLEPSQRFRSNRLPSALSVHNNQTKIPAGNLIPAVVDRPQSFGVAS